MKTSDRNYREYLTGKFLPGRQLYLELFLYPRLLRVLSPAHEVWDLGFGNGEFLSFCRKKGVAARGIDSNPFFVEAARAGGYQVAVDDITRLATVPDSTIPAALADNVLEHLDRVELGKAFHAIDRALAVNAPFLAVVPGEKGYTTDPTHRTFIDAPLVRELIAPLSLRLERSYRLPFNMHWMSRLLYLNMTVFRFRKVG
jgi:hypothetical protein